MSAASSSTCQSPKCWPPQHQTSTDDAPISKPVTAELTEVGWSIIAPQVIPAPVSESATPVEKYSLQATDMMLEIGNNSQPCNDDDKLVTLEEMKELGLTRWCWDMFLQAGRYSHCIESVVFHLPDTFEKSTVAVDAANSADGSFHSPAYSGHGEFTVSVEVHLKPGWDPQVLWFEHQLSLTVGGDSCQLPVHMLRTTATSEQDEQIPAPQCAICLNAVTHVTSMLGYCSHVFHDSCWKEYLEAQVTDGEVTICCPLCPRLVQREEVRQSVDQDVFKKFERFEANEKVECNPDLIWCPSPDCNKVLFRPDVSTKLPSPYPSVIRDLPVCIMSLVVSFAMACFWRIPNSITVSLLSASLTFTLQILQRHGVEQSKEEDAGIPVECDKCREIACFKCKAKWHPGETCEEAQISRLYNWTIGKDVGACPNCKCLIEKTQGCDHMTCRMCKRDFQWSSRHRALQKPNQLSKFLLLSCFALCLPCSALWLVEFMARLRDLGCCSGLASLFDDLVLHIAIAGLIALGFFRFFDEILVDFLQPVWQLPTDMKGFIGMIAFSGITATCKSMVGLLGPVACICLYNVWLEFAIWRFQFSKVCKWPRVGRMIATLAPYLLIAGVFGLVTLFDHLPKCTMRQPDLVSADSMCQLTSSSASAASIPALSIDELSVSVAEAHSAGVARRCNILTCLHGVGALLAFFATLGAFFGVKFILDGYWHLPLSRGSGCDGSPAKRNGSAFLGYARFLALAIPLWMLIEGHAFQRTVRAAILVFSIGLCFHLFGKSQTLKKHLGAVALSVACVILLSFARLGFFVEDIIFIAVGGKSLSFAVRHVFKWPYIRNPFENKIGMLLLDLCSCVLGLVLLLIDTREDGTRGHAFRPAITVTTPTCLCLLPLQLRTLVSQIDWSFVEQPVAEPQFDTDNSDIEDADF